MEARLLDRSLSAGIDSPSARAIRFVLASKIAEIGQPGFGKGTPLPEQFSLPAEGSVANWHHGNGNLEGDSKYKERLTPLDGRTSAETDVFAVKQGLLSLTLLRGAGVRSERFKAKEVVEWLDGCGEWEVSAEGGNKMAQFPVPFSANVALLHARLTEQNVTFLRRQVAPRKINEVCKGLPVRMSSKDEDGVVTPSLVALSDSSSTAQDSVLIFSAEGSEGAPEHAILEESLSEARKFTEEIGSNSLEDTACSTKAEIEYSQSQTRTLASDVHPLTMDEGSTACEAEVAEEIDKELSNIKSMSDCPQARPNENATSLGDSLRSQRTGMFSDSRGANTRVGKLHAFVGALRAAGMKCFGRGRGNAQRL